MSRNLHGGGIPLVAEIPAHVIWLNTDPEHRSSFVQRFYTYSDGKPDKTAWVEISTTKGDDGRAILTARSSPEVEFLRGDASDDRDTNTGSNKLILRKKDLNDCNFYDRIVEDPASKGPLPAKPALHALAAAMQNDTTARTVSGIPAAYTYLGQFIAHDMTWMQASTDPLQPINARTHALDLDSMFGVMPPGHQPVIPCQPGDLCVGETTTPGHLEDLPRDVTGYPCITDPRNDNNLAVGQLTVALMKFHQKICKLAAKDSPESQKKITRRHVQSVVLHDYLYRIIDETIYCDVMHNGRKLIHVKPTPLAFHVSLEFAAACFRFGHTMVRSDYNWNMGLQNQPTAEVRRRSHLGVISYDPSDTQDLPFHGRLADDWIVDWAKFAEFPAGHTTPQFAASIGGPLAYDLRSLPENWRDPNSAIAANGPFNLAEATLLRGYQLAMPTGQAVVGTIVSKLGLTKADIPLLAPNDILPPGSPVAQLLQQANAKIPCISEEIADRTPLWFYILREAQVRGGGGGRLGPVCSRIVMETIHAAIEETPDNIISGSPFEVLNGLQSDRADQFRLDELITSSRNQP